MASYQEEEFLSGETLDVLFDLLEEDEDFDVAVEGVLDEVF